MSIKLKSGKLKRNKVKVLKLIFRLILDGLTSNSFQVWYDLDV